MGGGGGLHGGLGWGGGRVVGMGGGVGDLGWGWGGVSGVWGWED